MRGPELRDEHRGSKAVSLDAPAADVTVTSGKAGVQRSAEAQLTDRLRLEIQSEFQQELFNTKRMLLAEITASREWLNGLAARMDAMEKLVDTL